MQSLFGARTASSGWTDARTLRTTPSTPGTASHGVSGGRSVSHHQHMKQGVIQRNGIASSPYGVMTEHIWRHGDYLTLHVG